jgi:hypothetical protein
VTAVAWFPLGPREVYVPAYRVSPLYVNRVNVRTVNVTNITVINRTYVNRTYITAVDHQAFVGARPVNRAIVPVSSDVVMRSRVFVHAPVAPQRVSVLGYAGAPVNVPRPNARVIERPVYAQRTPPPAPVSFAARQQALQASPGRPVDRSTMEQIRTSAPAVRQPAVRTLPPSAQGRQFGSQANPDRPSTFDRTTRQPPAQPRNRPDYSNPNYNRPQSTDPQQPRRNHADTTPAAPTAPAQPDPQVRPRQRTRPEARTPSSTPAPTPQRPERPAVQAQPQPQQQRPAATAPHHEERPASTRENRRDDKKKEEK